VDDPPQPGRCPGWPRAPDACFHLRRTWIVVLMGQDKLVEWAGSAANGLLILDWQQLPAIGCPPHHAHLPGSVPHHRLPRRSFRRTCPRASSRLRGADPVTSRMARPSVGGEGCAYLRGEASQASLWWTACRIRSATPRPTMNPALNLAVTG
jgi:hypothetical protein